jgi:hypothetical protein
MLSHLVDAELVYRPEMEPLTRDGEGELIGSGDGTVVGDAITARSRGRCSSGRASSVAR